MYCTDNIKVKQCLHFPQKKLFMQLRFVLELVPLISVTFNQTYTLCKHMQLCTFKSKTHTHTVLIRALSLSSLSLSLSLSPLSLSLSLSSFMSLREVTPFEWLPFSAALVCVWCVRALCNLLSAVSLSRHSFIRLWGAEYQATSGPPD